MTLFRITIVTCVLATSIAVLGGCNGESSSNQPDDDRSTTTLPEANGRNLPALGEELLLALAQAKNFHHKADVQLKQANIGEALASIREILTIAFPEDAPEAEDVKLDARARLAKLLNVQGNTTEAMSVVDTGIASATRRSFFLANLHTVRGEIYEAMANMLDDDESDEARDKARAARRSAIEAFDKSIEINAELQKALMNERTP